MKKFIMGIITAFVFILFIPNLVKRNTETIRVAIIAPLQVEAIEADALFV